MQHHGDKDWIYTGQAQEDIPQTVRRVQIAESVTRIPDEVFQEHPELEEVILSFSVQVIGKFTFEKCKKLKFIDIPST
eukprot:scaffold11657_cov56-Cylindrotheca_fusiformis.AAC.1